jgi:hypothetical protein
VEEMSKEDPMKYTAPMPDGTGLAAGDYKRALDVQDACNLSGVVSSFSSVMSKIWEEARKVEGRGTKWVNEHPIAILYSSKIASLSGSDMSARFARSLDMADRWSR